MPVAVVIGGDPAVHLAAAAPMPSAVDPLGLAGLLREKPLDAVAGRSIDLLVPAESDIVIEGYIDPAGRRSPDRPAILAHRPHHRGPAGTHHPRYGHDASGQSYFSGGGSRTRFDEVCVRDRVLARVFLPLVKLRIPELVDFDLPLSGGARHLAIIAIHKTYAGQARQVATAAWGLRPLGFAKLLVVVDAEVDVRDAEQVWAAIAHEAHLVRDVWRHAAPPDPLDPTSSGDELGCRMAIDATRKFAAEGHASRARNLLLDGDVEKLVSDRWAQYGLGPE